MENILTINVGEVDSFERSTLDEVHQVAELRHLFKVLKLNENFIRSREAGIKVNTAVIPSAAFIRQSE